MAHNVITKIIWQWAIPRNIWLSAALCVWCAKSCDFDDNTVWSLTTILFAQILEQFYILWVSLFASRLNHKGGHTFVQWKPEPEAWAIEALGEI